MFCCVFTAPLTLPQGFSAPAGIAGSRVMLHFGWNFGSPRFGRSNKGVNAAIFAQDGPSALTGPIHTRDRPLAGVLPQHCPQKPGGFKGNLR